MTMNSILLKCPLHSSVRIHDLKPHHNKASLTCMVSNDIGVNSDRAVIRVFGKYPFRDTLYPVRDTLYPIWDTFYPVRD